MRIFFVLPDRTESNSIRLDAEELHHAQKVLRLKSGERVRVLDGAGGVFEGPLDLKTGCVSIEESSSVPRPRCEVTLGMALVKGDRWDWFLEKSVEIGVARILPIRTEHSVVRIAPGDAKRKVQRWRQISIGALKQSGQGFLPEILEPVPFTNALQREGQTTSWILSARGGKPLQEVLRPELARVHALIGPEGGWSESEMEAATTSGFEPVSLGSQILRAETAPLYLLAAIRFVTSKS